MRNHDLRNGFEGDLDADLRFAVDAARVTGERALAVRQTGRWKDGVLADVGDQAADGFVQGFVRGRYPNDGILSEETADTTARASKRRVWIIDPLDGTREYSQLRHDWAVHVALTYDGVPVLGAVALPAQSRVIFGICLPGHEHAGLEGDGALADARKPPETRTRIAVSRSHTPSWMPRFAELVQADLVHSGSVGNKVAMLLLGEADLYAHRRGLKEWDTCAPEAVARALGWSVSRFSGEAQRYNQSDPRNDEFLMCRPGQREHVLVLLRESGAIAGA